MLVHKHMEFVLKPVTLHLHVYLHSLKKLHFLFNIENQNCTAQMKEQQ